nr:uncharacterized protein LOC114826072 [Malus domestica]
MHIVWYRRPFDPNTTLIGEGSWDAETNQLSCVAFCLLYYSNMFSFSCVTEDMVMEISPLFFSGRVKSHPRFRPTHHLHNLFLPPQIIQDFDRFIIMVFITSFQIQASTAFFSSIRIVRARRANFPLFLIHSSSSFGMAAFPTIKMKITNHEKHNTRVGDCSTRITLRFPAVWTIGKTSSMAGVLSDLSSNTWCAAKGSHQQLQGVSKVVSMASKGSCDPIDPTVDPPLPMRIKCILTIRSY